VLMAIATDKANMDIEAPAAGTVAEVPVAPEDIVSTSAVLLVLET